MKFKTLMGAALCLFVTSSFAQQVKLSGHVPSLELPGLQQKIDKIWQHEAQTYLLAPKNYQTVAPPEIAFYEFERADEDPEWQSWQNDWIIKNPSIWLDWTLVSGVPQAQITPRWIDDHIRTLFPFPGTFLAFHYDNTNRIQVSPSRTFLHFYQNDPYGMKSETVGYGYYTAAHEILHYMLEQNGIPGRLHHCLFVSEKNGRSLMGDMTNFLISTKISAPIIKTFGYEAERGMMPCEQLSGPDRQLAKDILEQSKVWN